MPDNKKITQLDEIVSIASDDALIIVDVNDFTQSSTGTDKKITIGQLQTELTGTVESVNGSVGVVVLTAADVGADTIGSAATVQSNLDTHIADDTNPHDVTQDQVGLGNVDNTSDADKPVSDATAVELNLKGDKVDVDLNTTHRGLSDNPHSVTKTQVSLGNVDNTADLDKPISTDTQAALDAKVTSVVSGTGIAVDATDPQNPIVSATGSGTGDVVGPASATDNAIARFDSTTGKLIQDGPVTISDAGNVAGVANLLLDITGVTPGTTEGTVYWNEKEYTIDTVTGLGTVLQLGQETVVLYKNETGSTITDGQVLKPSVTAVVDTVILPTVVLAKADTFENCNRTLFIATSNVLNGEVGFGTIFGKVRELNTTAMGGAGQVYLSGTVAGELTTTRPDFPCYEIAIGRALNDSTTVGEVFVNQSTVISDTINDAWNGAIRETFDFRVTSDGTDITGTLTNPNATHDDLTLIFGSGFYTFDCPANGAITLTAGTATVPQMNYVYIPKSTKVLTVSTTEFPADEHCKVAKILVQDAVTVQTDGAIRNQNINDHIKSDDDNGHILHMAERIRTLNADYDSGIGPTLSGTPTDVQIATTSGIVYQMHKQAFPAQDMSTGDEIKVVNDPTTPYRSTSNLNTVTTYSDGSAWNNEWQNIVVWGVANKTGETSYLMCNLASDGYNTEDGAISDRNNYTNYAIPDSFKGVGFLIGRFTIRRSSTTYTYNPSTGFLDLRGYYPNTTVGGGTGSSGITDWTQLTDTPSSLTGQAGKIPKVNAGETALEFMAPTGADATFVTGTAGTSGNLATWNADGDLVDGGAIPSGGDEIVVLDMVGTETTDDDTATYQYRKATTSSCKFILGTTGVTPGKRLVISNIEPTNTSYAITIEFEGSTVDIDMVYRGGIKEYVFNGTTWAGAMIGTGDGTFGSTNCIQIGKFASGNSGLAIGNSASGTSNGVAIGNGAQGDSDGVGVGDNADGDADGVAVGYRADADTNGVAIGYQADSELQDAAVALGNQSECGRWQELWKCADQLSVNKVGFGTSDAFGTTANATPVELFLGEDANKRLTLFTNSALSFTVHAVARDNTSGDCASFIVKGGIKRGATAATTALIGTPIKESFTDDATWDFNVSADTTNGSLKLEVTGDATNSVEWNIRVDYSDVRI